MTPSWRNIYPSRKATTTWRASYVVQKPSKKLRWRCGLRPNCLRQNCAPRALLIEFEPERQLVDSEPKFWFSERFHRNVKLTRRVLVGWWKIQANCIWPKKESWGIPFLQAACCVNRWLTILESHIWSFPFQVRPVTSAGNRAKVSLEIFDLIKEGWSLATHQFMDLMISFRP